MRAAAFAELTGPDGVELIEQEAPEAGPGEAVVEVRACSINRHDLWILQGHSAMIRGEELPFVSGLDPAGLVREAGEGAPVEEGDRVLLCPNQTCGTCDRCREGPENTCESFSLYHGGLAEQALVDADRLIPVPDDLSLAAASALPTAYLTAWHMLKKADVTAGDRVFVPGATGGVGLAGCQLAGVLGAESVGTTTSERKAERLADFADEVVVGRDAGDIVAAAGEGSADAALNHLSGEFTDVCGRVLRTAGTQVVCGRTAGETLDQHSAPFFLSHQAILGSTMGTQPELERLVGMAAEGRFDPLVDRTYPLDETATAFADMEERDAFGKLVVTP
ncbi:alcohol dehydrogenase catalytic domain-containing protein [Halosegnis marinus]|uniref:Alcohol dehydrogenase catalytic domain-containing protein n=1 Tax=Halosegnis marinus TaxID=3034023 RepID=A0ABD5ZS40_9EURY|nr:alcohol dehydrogenase catalytic domain-containing protein [Halosegnis sp. DT85]